MMANTQILHPVLGRAVKDGATDTCSRCGHTIPDEHVPAILPASSTRGCTVRRARAGCCSGSCRSRTGAAMGEEPRRYAAEGIHKAIQVRGERVQLACSGGRLVKLTVMRWSTNGEFATCRLCRKLLEGTQRDGR
jgi:hypothetical protein